VDPNTTRLAHDERIARADGWLDANAYPAVPAFCDAVPYSNAAQYSLHTGAF
jgi:hypothetical protein